MIYSISIIQIYYIYIYIYVYLYIDMFVISQDHCQDTCWLPVKLVEKALPHCLWMLFRSPPSLFLQDTYTPKKICTPKKQSQSDIGDPFPSIWWCIKIRTCYLGTACSQDKFIKRVQRIHQQITEQTSTTEHEFYSEQDMVDAGWSELLGF